MPNVFVSYSHRDSALAEALVVKLRAALPDGTDIFFDRPIDKEVESIPTGAYWLPYLGQRLRSANAVVALVTPAYLASDACWFEMSAALAMEKLLPLNAGAGLDLGKLGSLVSQKNIPSISAEWLTATTRSEPNQHDAAFDNFAKEVAAACKRLVPFSEWVVAKPESAGALAAKLDKAFRPGWFKKTGLEWLPGRLRKPQVSRFLAAIRELSAARGDGAWDKGLRKALKALAAEPGSKRVRAEALMGLVGELLMPSDGSAPITGDAPWKLVGDLALPIDRDISRFAYLKAGDVPNELRAIFQVLHPRATGRTAALTIGLAGGGLIGFLIGYGVHDVPLPCIGCSPPPPPCPSDQCPPPGPQEPLTIAIPIEPPNPPPQTFIVGELGLEAAVKAELTRRQQPVSEWRRPYSEVISSNMMVLCSPERWKAAEDEAKGRAPLDLIAKGTILVWPDSGSPRSQARLRSCPASSRYILAASNKVE